VLKASLRTSGLKLNVGWIIPEKLESFFITLCAS
jgi:hypothetical protein